ncbi:hypothetical protein ACFQBQ_02330 [Granulicella cerasi]|uniref:Uncharacterized protein n=1 Tax=Granulicella cerasi TaxID=741063 RepID=A0ABW1Z6F2_9BACT|nr:hypothetical protein [Granulicella cerasi]
MGVIAASAGTLAAVVAKDAKVSEFRQQWIDALRNDVSEYCSLSVGLYNENMRARAALGAGMSLTPTSSELVMKLNTLGYRIRLRLDMQKPESRVLVEALDELVEHASHTKQMFHEVNACVLTVLNRTAVILDKAWKKVRRGETRFRWAFWILIFILGGSISLAVVRWIALHLYPLSLCADLLR